MAETRWSKLMPVLLGAVLGNLMVADFPMFQDYAPTRLSPVAFHVVVGVMGLVLAGYARDQGLLQAIILILSVAFVVTWTIVLVVGARVGSGHFLDVLLWSLFTRSALVALIDGPLLLLAALAGAAWLPGLPR